MEFRPYQHIERLGTNEIQPSIDADGVGWCDEDCSSAHRSKCFPECVHCDVINSDPEHEPEHTSLVPDGCICPPYARQQASELVDVLAERDAIQLIATQGERELKRKIEGLREGIMQIHEHHAIPRKHRRGSTTKLCEALLLARPSAGAEAAQSTGDGTKERGCKTCEWEFIGGKHCKDDSKLHVCNGQNHWSPKQPATHGGMEHE